MATTKTTRKTKKKTPDKKQALLKEEAEVILPPGITNKQIGEQIITLLVSKKRIAAIQAYRFATGLGLKQANEDLSGWWKDYQLQSVDPKTYPEHCCYNCVGCCGQLVKFRTDFGTKLWDTSSSCPLGTACSRFMTPKAFEKAILESYPRGVRICFCKVGIRHNTMSIFVDDPIVSTVIADDSGQDSGKNTKQILSIGKVREETLKLVIEHMLQHNWQYDGISQFNGSLRYRGCEPKSQEGWEEYVKRANDEIVARRVEIADKFTSMPPAEVDEFLLDYIQKRGLANQLKAFDDDLDWFLNEFFPNMDHHEIAIMWLRDELR